MEPPRWNIITPSQYEWERRGLDLIRTGLPDHDPYRAWANFEFQTSDGAIHEVDLLRWFVGDEVTSVYAESRTTDPNTEVPDFISIQMRFGNGALAASEVVTNLPHDYPLFHHLEVFGTDGAINANDPDMRTFSETTTEGTREPLNFDTLLHIDTAYEDELRGLLDAIARDTEVPLPPREARQAVLLSVAAVWSSRKGQVAHIQPDFNFTETGEGTDA